VLQPVMILAGLLTAALADRQHLLWAGIAMSAALIVGAAVSLPGIIRPGGKGKQE